LAPPLVVVRLVRNVLVLVLKDVVAELVDEELASKPPLSEAVVLLKVDEVGMPVVLVKIDEDDEVGILG